MQSISTSRFLVAMTFLSVGWLALMLPRAWWFADLITPLCTTVGFLVSLSPASRQRQIPPRELLLGFVFLLAFILVVIGSEVLVLGSINQKLESAFRSPFFVIPSWILFVALGIRLRRRRQRAVLPA